jgi:predicted TIM-barrel fold metal-dependent hydrolase
MHISPIRIPKQLSEFENLLKSFPDVTMVAAHYGRMAPEFTEGVRLLDQYPNLYMDVSMGGGLSRYQKEIPVALKKYREFILKYQDRLLWGTDVILTRKTTKEFLRGRSQIDFLVLGKPFYVDLREGHDSTVVHTGLALPRSVLRKIFYENPKRILKIA